MAGCSSSPRRPSTTIRPGTAGRPRSCSSIRGTDGRWTNTLYARLQDQVGSPLIAYDATAGIIYAMATTPKAGGQVAFKRTWPDDPTFEAGSGSPLVAEPTNPTIGAGTTTKGPVSTATGLVVLAWDATTGRYLHGVLDLGGGILAGPKPAAGSTAGPQAVFADDFNPWPAGSHPATGWDLRSSDRPTAFVIKSIPNNPTRTNSAAIVTPAGQPGHPRLQVLRDDHERRPDGRPQRPAEPGRQLGRRGDRGPRGIRRGGQHPGRPGRHVRLLQRRHEGEDDGSSPARGLVSLGGRRPPRQPDLRLAALRLSRPGPAIVRGIRWRTPVRAPLDDVCLRTPTGPAGIEVDWDDVRVIR